MKKSSRKLPTPPAPAAQRVLAELKIFHASQLPSVAALLEDDSLPQHIKRGTQVVYVPQHCQGNLMHCDVEAGFVTSYGRAGSVVFCRYWHKNTPLFVLRTCANSEATDASDLYKIDTAPQSLVDKMLQEYC